MSDWLAIGPADNWELGVKKKLWAVNHRMANSWAKVEPGDRVFLYATAPVKGIVGYAVVAKTDQAKEPFWPQEKDIGQVMWPFQIRFREVHALPRRDWEAKAVLPERQGIVFQRAFQPAPKAKEWAAALKKRGVWIRLGIGKFFTIVRNQSRN